MQIARGIAGGGTWQVVVKNRETRTAQAEAGAQAGRPGCPRLSGMAQLWVILVPSTAMHSRMNAASPVQPFAETMVPST